MNLILSAFLISGIYNFADCSTQDFIDGRGTAFIIKEKRKGYSLKLLHIKTSPLISSDNKLNFKNEEIEIHIEKEAGLLKFKKIYANGNEIAITENSHCYKKK